MWCRRTLDLPVRNEVDVTSIRWEENLFRVAFEARERGSTFSDHLYARHVVLATGLEGSGNWQTPEFIREALPRTRYGHAGEAIEFDALTGKRVAVLGAGASAFDNASTALEHGATSAVLCIRRKEIRRVNPQLWMGKAGFLRHFADLSDPWKWRFMQHMFSFNLPAPQDAYDRLSQLPGAEIRQTPAGSRCGSSARTQEIEIETVAGDVLRADFLIVAVGFEVDFHRRRELAPFADQIALWHDRFSVPVGEEHSVVATYPYLGSTFEFVEKVAGGAPYLGASETLLTGRWSAWDCRAQRSADSSTPRRAWSGASRLAVRRRCRDSVRRICQLCSPGACWSCSPWLITSSRTAEPDFRKPVCSVRRFGAWPEAFVPTPLQNHEPTRSAQEFDKLLRVFEING